MSSASASNARPAWNCRSSPSRTPRSAASKTDGASDTCAATTKRRAVQRENQPERRAAQPQPPALAREVPHPILLDGEDEASAACVARAAPRDALEPQVEVGQRNVERRGARWRVDQTSGLRALAPERRRAPRRAKPCTSRPRAAPRASRQQGEDVEHLVEAERRVRVIVGEISRCSRRRFARIRLRRRPRRSPSPRPQFATSQLVASSAQRARRCRRPRCRRPRWPRRRSFKNPARWKSSPPTSSSGARTCARISAGSARSASRTRRTTGPPDSDAARVARRQAASARALGGAAAPLRRSTRKRARASSAAGSGSGATAADDDAHRQRRRFYQRRRRRRRRRAAAAGARPAARRRSGRRPTRGRRARSRSTPPRSPTRTSGGRSRGRRRRSRW